MMCHPNENGNPLSIREMDSRLRGNDNRIKNIYFVLLVSFPSMSDLYF